MKISITATPHGIQRQIDFQGATLPDGRPINEILNENKNFKKEIANLKMELNEKSSIFAKIIQWKSARDILEVVIFIFGIIGIIQIILSF